MDHVPGKCQEPGALCKGNFQGNLKLFILQPTTFCNIDCDYCYLFDRDNHNFMSLETLEVAIQQLFSSLFLSPRITIMWHAGEPLVAPIDYYKEAVRLVKKYNTSGIQVFYVIQTNGTLINQDWCEFFAENEIKIGVSIDGPKFANDAHRKTRAGKGVFERVVQGIELLRSNSIEFHCIAVVSDPATINGTAFYDFFEKLGCTSLAINFQESEGANRVNSLLTSDKDYEIKEFIRSVREAWQKSNYKISSREFSFYLKRLIEGEFETCPAPQDSEAFRIISVDYKGDYSTFSPELLGVETNLGKFVLGNVHTSEFEESVYTESFERFYNSIAQGIRLCAEHCEYFGVCGGGTPSNKYFENGDFSSTTTRACETNVKFFADEAIRLAIELSQAATKES